jgi:outer membrane receptor protein involved in Fe transport
MLSGQTTKLSIRGSYRPIVAALLCVVSYPALAQTATSGASDSGNAAGSASSSGDIIVTAQKRDERLQDVPIPVSVISSSAMVRNGTTKIADLFSSVPGLNATVIGNGQVSLSVRGITTSAKTNPAVGVVIDDVPFGGSTGVSYASRIQPDLDPAMLQQVEVLRGPQGTLYGASSIGGLLKYVTKDPSTAGLSGTVQGDVNTIAHGGLGWGLRGSINVPVTENLAILAGAFGRRDAGYIDNLTTGKNNVNSVDAKGGQIIALWRPEQGVSLKVSALLQNTDGNGTSEVNANYHLQPTAGDLSQTRIPGTGQYQIRIRAFSAVANVAVGGATLSSISGYSISKYNGVLDVTPRRAANAAVFGVPYATQLNDFETKKFSQELRLSSSFGKLLDWSVGGFFTHDDVTPARQVASAVNATTLAFAGNISNASFPTTLSEYALFGNFKINLTDRFNIQAGARYSWISQTYDEFDTGLLFPGNATNIAPSKDHAFTYMVSPQFRVSSNLMLYARVATGYRVGGPNPGAALGFASQYGHDTTTEYEVGTKGSVFDRKLSFDLAAYRIDWTDIQLSVRDPATGFTYFANGGTARSQGVEATIGLTPFDGLHITANAAYNLAKLTENAPPGAPGLKGEILPYASKWSGNLNAEYDLPVGGAMRPFLGGGVTYVSKRFDEFQTAPLVRLVFPRYTTFDLRAGVHVNSWTFNVYAVNIGDKRGITGGSTRTSSNTVAAPYAVNYITPRKIGLSVERKF